MLTAVVAFALAGCGGGDPVADDKKDSETSTDNDSSEAGTPESLSFKSETIDGESFDGSSLAGEPVVLWFWAPWCPKCQGASDEVAKAAKANDKISVVGVAGLDDSVDNMTKFVADHGIDDITNLADPDGKVWKKFEVTSQHTYVLIDGDGKVTFTGSIADAELGAKIAELAG